MNSEGNKTLIGLLMKDFGHFGMQNFIAVRKEDAGEYYCRAKNDAGYTECPPQLMEVCKCITAAHPKFPPTLQLFTLAPSDSIPADDIDVVGIVLGVLVVVVVLLCITAGICCAYKRGFFSSQKQTGNR